MFAFLTNWLRCRRDAMTSAYYGEGFNYAAGALLQGVNPNTLEQECSDMMSVTSYRSLQAVAFDTGVAAACREWRKSLGRRLC